MKIVRTSSLQLGIYLLDNLRLITIDEVINKDINVFIL